MKNRRQPQGYVLIMVLMVLLVLTLLVASLYGASEDSRFTAQTMMAQRVAAVRADQAAQIAIARLRSGLTTITNLTYCTSPVTKLRTGTCTDATTQYVTSGVVSGSASPANLENGAGLQYQWWIYKQSNPDGTVPAQTAEIYNVYAEGYYGYTDTSPNLSIAAVSAEITLPGQNSGPPNFDGDYGVIH